MERDRLQSIGSNCAHPDVATVTKSCVIPGPGRAEIARFLQTDSLALPEQPEQPALRAIEAEGYLFASLDVETFAAVKPFGSKPATIPGMIAQTCPRGRP